jgi:hypothetical protein
MILCLYTHVPKNKTLKKQETERREQWKRLKQIEI